MAEILYGVKLVVLTPLDKETGLSKVGSNKIVMQAAQEASVDPVISKGEEKILRDDDRILAVARTKDITYGYNFKLKDARPDLNIIQLIEGGTFKCEDPKDPKKITGYASPRLGEAVDLDPFRTEIYVGNYEGDSIKNYAKVTLNKCEGNAPGMAFKKDFYSPEFQIDARENTKAGLTAKEIDFVDKLPDLIVPVVVLVSTGTVTIGTAVKARSNKLGSFYLVNQNDAVTDVASLEALVTAKKATKAQITAKDTDISIGTTGLTAGKYNVYAVDTNGNLSVPASITLA